MVGSISSSDRDLLRRFEPVIKFTRGERFYPMDVDRYVNECSLWVQRPKEPPELIIPQGELTLEKLAQARQYGFGSVYYIKFIDPLDLIELARISINEAVKYLTHGESEDVFHAGRGRLARVGYTSRFIDAIFSLTLLMRGRVPGDTSKAAAITYHRIQTERECYSYYGRVVHENGWIVLQYWFFYPFNNWRTGFFGVNDHEGDWEMISIYCSDDLDAEPGLPVSLRIRPYWVAYASHDYFGDDLRRHWDDPEVEKIGEHPVIYAGAGSHASYFQAGEYLAEIELTFLTPVAKFLDKIKGIWTGTLRQSVRETNGSGLQIFSVPFVDYARGDGLIIGPGQNREWEQFILNPPPPWVKNYRGLWGLYARDPIAGENAPGGPMYNRDGSVRTSWYDPLAWAGLDKVPPPDEELKVIDRRRAQIWEGRSELENKIAKISVDLSGMGLEAEAMKGYPHLERKYNRQIEQIEALSHELTQYRRQLTVLDAKIEAYNLLESRLMINDTRNLRGHIRRAHHPSTEVDLRLGFLAEVFSAVSVSFLVLSIVVLIVFAREYLLFGLVALVGLLIFLESGFRRQLTRLISSLTVALAVVTTFILLFQFFWEIVVSIVLLAGVYILWENLKEFRR
jgi:hypothetical protein